MLRFLSVVSIAVLATGCATSGESESESTSEAQQAVTTDAATPADSAATQKLKQQHVESELAATLGTTTLESSAPTLNKIVSVPAGGTVTCSTIDGTTLDTVLAIVILQNPFAGTRGPCDSPFTDQIGWNLVAFNDDSSGTLQSRVAYHNPDGIARNVRLLGFQFSGSVGTGTVTCTGTSTGTIVTTENFTSNSVRAVPTSTTVFTTFLTGSTDTTLFALPPSSIPTGNAKSNDDCRAGGPTVSPLSCMENNATGILFWYVDLGCFGTKPRTSTVNF